MINPKESVAKLSPYVDGNHSARLIQNHTHIYKLDSNEPTARPSAKVVEAIVNYVNQGPIQWYPDVRAEILCGKIANYTGLPTDHILSFNGSDHALECLARTFIDKNDRVVIFQPTYDHFRVYADSCDAQRVMLSEQSEGSLTQKLMGAGSDPLRLVYLVRPNNPTGQLVPQAELEDALSQFADTVFIVDEAYYEFCGETAAGLVSQYPNLVVTRSFSKAFGLASLRCGYLLAQPALCAMVNKIRVGKHVNALAQVAAAAALDDIPHMLAYVEEVRMAKAWVLRELERRGVPVISTPANFILFRVNEPEKVLSFFENHNIYLRNRSMLPGLTGYLRLTVGSREVMGHFWNVFEKIPSQFI